MRDAFDELVGRLDYPMFIVTAARGDEHDGCLIGFATQCSIEPPRFFACLSKRNRTYRIAERAEMLGVHVVPEDAPSLAELFGGETGDETDKLERIGWRQGPGSVPLLEACPARFVGRVLERLDVGDHIAFLLEPVTAEANGAGRALGFQRVKEIEPGHEP